MTGACENRAPTSEKMANWPDRSIASFTNTGRSMAVRGCMRSCAQRRVRCSKQRVARLMREMELAAKRRRHKPVGTIRSRGAQVVANLLNREFKAETPNRKWVSDT